MSDLNANSLKGNAQKDSKNEPHVELSLWF